MHILTLLNYSAKGKVIFLNVGSAFIIGNSNSKIDCMVKILVIELKIEFVNCRLQELFNSYEKYSKQIV